MDHAVDCMILPINCKGIRRSSKIICYIARFWARRRMRPLKILLHYAKIHIHEATKGILHFPDGGYLFFFSCALYQGFFLFLSSQANADSIESWVAFIRICVYMGAKNLSYYFSCPSPDRQNRLFSASANPSDSFLSMDGGQSGAGCSCGGQHRSNRICPPYTRLRQTVWFWP